MASTHTAVQPTRFVIASVLVAALWGGCATRSGSSSAIPENETAEACATRLNDFRAFVAALPDRPLLTVGVGLPVATVGEVPGPGPILEVTPGAARIDGAPLAGSDTGARAAAFGEWLSSHPFAGEAGRAPVLYVAATPEVDVQTLRAYLRAVPESVVLRLLVRIPAPPRSEVEYEAVTDTVAARVLTETDPVARRDAAMEGYREHSSCAAWDEAVASVTAVDPEQRWPALKRSILDASSRCACGALDTERLRPLVVAEQRAGAGSLGALPLSFIRDERCGAAMPLRSVQKLLRQFEQFDSEFAGNFQKDALSFDKVLTNERLLVYFCDALPGETLAALQKAAATVYWKTPDGCVPWRFEPLQPGSPWGTWRRVRAGAPDLAFHYRQAAEKLNVYGPVIESPPSLPTDEETWSCEQTFSLTGIDEHSIHLEGGRWFYDEATCRKADAASVPPAGCVTAMASER